MPLHSRTTLAPVQNGEQMGLTTLQVARWAAELRYEQIPEAVLTYAKQLFLDGIACTIHGGRQEAGLAILKYARGLPPGTPAATVWAGGEKLPLTAAALVNGTCGQASNIGDTHAETVIHTNYITPQAAVAVAEQVGGTGREILSAIVAGNEVCLRAGQATRIGKEGGFFSDDGRGWHSTGSLGGIGAAITASRLLHLDVPATVQALTLAGAQGFAAYRPCGPFMGKPLFVGKALAQGLEAAYIARSGFIAGYRLYEDGLCHGTGLLSPVSDLAAAADGLGRRWETGNVDLAIYPAKKIAYTNIDALLAIVQAEGLAFEQIEKVVVRTFYEPPRCTRPTSATDALNSLQFSIAAAAHAGDYGPAQLEPGCWSDPEILAFAEERVEVIKDLELLALQRAGKWPGAVRVLTKDGRSFARQFDYHVGQVQNPVSAERLEQKFRSLTATLAERNVDRLIAMVRNLETLEDVSQLTALLQPQR